MLFEVKWSLFWLYKHALNSTQRSNKSEYVKLLWISFVQKTGAINKYLIDKKKTKNNKGKNAREPAIDKEWKRYYNFIKYVWNL